MQRNIGRFEIPVSLIKDDPELVMSEIMGNCVVVRAEMMWERKVIEYTALSPSFDEVPECGMAPTYSVVVIGPNARFERQHA